MEGGGRRGSARRGEGGGRAGSRSEGEGGGRAGSRSEGEARSGAEARAEERRGWWSARVVVFGQLCTNDSKGTVCDSGNNNNNSGNDSSCSVRPPIMAMRSNGNSGDIDEDLHSRHLAVYGRETMRKLFTSNILVSGMQGLGAEIAKNLVLAGVKSVTLHDEGVVELWDLSGNFFFTEEDVGKNRALSGVQKLQELNNAVLVSSLTTQLSKEKLADFQFSLKFKPLREAVKEPGDFLLIDFSKFDRPPILHLEFQALDKFASELGRFPIAGSENDATKFISLVTSINDSSADGKLEGIDEKILRHFAFGARAVLNPMAAMFGRIVGQEVAKACSADIGIGIMCGLI